MPNPRTRSTDQAPTSTDNLPAAAAAILEAAARLIRRNGLHQGGLLDLDYQRRSLEPAGLIPLPPRADTDCPLCAIGAIKCAATGAVMSDCPESAALALIALNAGVHPDKARQSPKWLIARWNDEPGRTARDVADALRRTARTLRSDPAPALHLLAGQFPAGYGNGATL